ncbi:MAG: hypothetical protein OXC46_01850, partial [Thaumarchaeota archaeon]|nr:hypothetical protein [Nitrososphaerota archaeon]
MFATLIAISSLSITFEDSFAQTITIDSVSQITDGGTLELAGAYGITSFKIGTSTYVAVASFTDNGVQILSVDSAGAVSAVSQIDNDSTVALNIPNAITSFKIGTSTYLAVASLGDDGVQILSVDSAGAVSAVSQITDGGSRELAGAYGITSFKIGTSTYLAVASSSDNGVQILSVDSAGAVSAVSQITDGGSRVLAGARHVTSFQVDSSTYLAVASYGDNGVQILSVDSAGAVSTVSQITDGGSRELAGANRITSFKIG